MIGTERLILRAWRREDARAHHAIVNDPLVAATLGEPSPRRQSGKVVARQNALLAEHGYCFWALEERQTGRFIGWCGIKPGKLPIKQETEIGWSLASRAWGRGLAQEAAMATLAWAWANTDLRSIAAVTTPGNRRSWRLMERLGMVRCPEADFDHPDLAEDDPLRPHILYRIARPHGA